MVEILEFVYAMILFLPLFLVITEVDGGKSFLILFNFFYLLCSLYTIFYHVLVNIIYFSFPFSLQYIFIVKLMPIVHKLQTGFMLSNVLITNVNWLKSFADYMSTKPKRVQKHPTYENGLLC